VAVESQRKNKAIGTRSPETLLPFSLHGYNSVLYAPMIAPDFILDAGSVSRIRSIFGQLQQQMIIQPILRHPRLAGRVPREFSRFGVQLDVVRVGALSS
jgi:hypothetical protein